MEPIAEAFGLPVTTDGRFVMIREFKPGPGEPVLTWLPGMPLTIVSIRRSMSSHTFTNFA